MIFSRSSVGQDSGVFFLSFGLSKMKIYILLKVLVLLSGRGSISTALQLAVGSSSAKPKIENLDYDCIIVGAGASGMFASGATSMLGSKTLLIDIIPTKSVNETFSETKEASSTYRSNNVGGDCTNFACVPSKAVRSVARMKDDFRTAQFHAASTVSKVKSRESPAAIVGRNPNLDLMLVSDCRFASPQEIEVEFPFEFYSSARSFNESHSFGDSNSFLCGSVGSSAENLTRNHFCVLR